MQQLRKIEIIRKYIRHSIHKYTMTNTNSVIKSLEICDNLGNINIISEYIDDDELLILLSNRYWSNKTHVNTLIETYDIGYNEFNDDNLQNLILHYETSCEKLTRNIHDILLYYFTEYKIEDIYDVIDFNEKKKTLDIWLHLSIINYNKLIEYLSTHFTLREGRNYTEESYI